MMMPEMDGWRFRQEQQRNPEIAGIPVGDPVRARQNVREAALALGVADYLPDPPAGWKSISGIAERLLPTRCFLNLELGRNLVTTDV